MKGVIIMKKIIFLFAVCVFVFAMAASLAYAEDEIVEVPDLKIIIDGKFTEQRDVPISVNQRTLLPARELAVKLGVPNDDEHIIWNNKEKSVTIIKDSTKIYFKLGVKTAYINDTPVELDAAPVGYINSRTYIPFRFLAEALGKKVIWDGSTKSIFVCDAENYEKVKEILEKHYEAVKSLNKYSIDLKIKTEMYNKYMYVPGNLNIITECDAESKKYYYLMTGEFLEQKLVNEFYCDENYMYSYVPGMDIWVKQGIEEESSQGIIESSNILDTDMESYNDILCSGLRIVEAEEENGLITLEGNVYPGGLIENLSKSLMNGIPDGIKANYFYYRITINKNTNLINEMNIKLEYSYPTSIGDIKLESDAKIDSTAKYDYSEDLVIEIPEEIIENAIDINETEEVTVEGVTV